MSVLSKTRLRLAKLLKLKFAKIDTDKGELNYEDGTELEVGSEVYVYDADGNTQLPENGDYTADGKVYTIVDGVVTEIRNEGEPAPEQVDEVMEDVSTEEETVAVAEEVIAEVDTAVEEVITVVEEGGDLTEVIEIVKDLTEQLAEVTAEVEEMKKKMSKMKMSSAKSVIKEVETKSINMNDPKDKFFNGWK